MNTNSNEAALTDTEPLHPDGELIPLATVPDLSWLPKRPDGKRLHPVTLCNWHRIGVNGVKLKVIKTHIGVCTTEAALREFFAARAGGPRRTSTGRTTAARARDIARAERELSAAGI